MKSFYQNKVDTRISHLLRNIQSKVLTHYILENQKIGIMV